MVPDGPFRGVPGERDAFPSAVAASRSIIRFASGRRPLASGNGRHIFANYVG